MIENLLSDEPISGTKSVVRHLFPPPRVIVVDTADFNGAIEAIKSSCGQWGGCLNAIVPAGRNALPDEPWASLIRRMLLVQVDLRNGMEPDQFDSQFGRIGERYGPSQNLLLNVLVRSVESQRGREWRPAWDAASIESTHSWATSYYTALGAFPASLGEMELRFNRLRDGLSYGEVVTLKDPSGELGVEHLEQLLLDFDSTTAANLSLALLKRRTSFTGHNAQRDLLPAVYDPLLDQVGSNVVVVYTPGDVRDLCLLWNLRAMHGAPNGLPLGVPIDADVPALVRELAYPTSRLRTGGIRGDDAVSVTSVSVEQDRLSALLDGEHVVVRPFDSLLGRIRYPFIESVDVVTFEDGRATLPALHPSDEQVIGADLMDSSMDSLQLNTIVAGNRLPRGQLLQSEGLFRPRFYEGCVVSISKRSDKAISWIPTGFQVLDTLCRDRGVSWRPSAPGRSATAMLDGFRGSRDLDMLASPVVAKLLDRLCSRRGQTFVKDRLERIIPKIDDEAEFHEAVSKIEESIHMYLGRPDDDDRREISFGQIQDALGGRRNAAKAWLRWSEERELVVRGFDLNCSQCGAKAWRPLSDLQATLICSGCGKRVERPFKEESLNFRYRSSERLLTAMNLDVLSHLLSMRFFGRVFRASGNDADGPIFAGYPGVEFIGEKGEVVGEADVVFVLEDGSLGLVECKKSASGLSERELQKLWHLADRLEASFTAVATLSGSEDCGDIWRRASPRQNTSHFSLTAEHLFDRSPYAALGYNPFEWRDAPVVGPEHQLATPEEVLTNFLDDVPSIAMWDTSVRKIPWTKDDFDF